MVKWGPPDVTFRKFKEERSDTAIPRQGAVLRSQSSEELLRDPQAWYRGSVGSCPMNTLVLGSGSRSFEQLGFLRCTPKQEPR